MANYIERFPGYRFYEDGKIESCIRNCGNQYTGRIIKYDGEWKPMKLIKDKYGYLTVRINGKFYKVHRLIAEAFIPNPENKPWIDHKNRVRDDNRIENLCWCTYKENAANRDNSIYTEIANKLNNKRWR